MSFRLSPPAQSSGRYQVYATNLPAKRAFACVFYSTARTGLGPGRCLHNSPSFRESFMDSWTIRDGAWANLGFHPAFHHFKVIDKAFYLRAIEAHAKLKHLCTALECLILNFQCA